LRVLREGGGYSGRGAGALALAVSALLLFTAAASFNVNIQPAGEVYVVNPPQQVKCTAVWDFGSARVCRTPSPLGARGWHGERLTVPPAAGYAPEGGVNIHVEVHGNSSLTGAGVVVAVVDTGIDYLHEAFDGAIEELWTVTYRTPGGTWLHWRVGVNGSLYDLASFDASFRSSRGEYAFMDENGHGTHVAGIIAGRRVGQWRGMAPAASLLVVKMFNRNGEASVEDALNALQLVYRLAGERRVDVVNLSWGAPVLSDGEDPISAAASAIARDRGVIVVAAAGNDGNRPASLSIPAAGKKVVAAGAVDPFTGKVAHFSSWGPTSDLRMKPDVVAAGVSIVGPRSSKSALPPYGGDPRLTRLSGTSMAAAVASGVAALFVQAARAAGLGGDMTEAFLAYTRFTRYNPYFKDFITGVGLPMAP
jgi:subtilisin family serine protease